MHIEGRRWFDKINGNTYHTVRIFSGSEGLLTLIPIQYGYGDQFLQTAVDWLRENGYPTLEYGTRQLREEVGASYSVIDVCRKKDL